MDESAKGQPILTMRGIVKRFPGVLALDGVDFELYPGEIHALMGENGAGKSTLVKVMTGVYELDEGSMDLDGKRIRPESPHHATELGISTVYQEVNLAPNLSVAENICLGREPRGPWGIRWREVHERARKALERLGLNIDPRPALGSYPVAIQQMVAIARALDIRAQVLVLDEPTSSLDQAEVQRLFGVMRALRGQGLAIVFVTHFLDQVYEVSDRITVLRNGQRVASERADDLTRHDLVRNMLGRELGQAEARSATTSTRDQTASPLLKASHVGRRGVVAQVDVDVRPGDVLGFAGLLGSGRTETLKILFGIDPFDHGAIEVEGRSVHRWSIRKAINARFAFCPEDRKVSGIMPDLSVRENLILVLQARRGWLRRLPKRSQAEIVESFIRQLDINVPDVEGPIRNLSGGNQQKVLLARWLAAEPKLMLLDEPTRGIDVGAKLQIMNLVESMRQQGIAFVFVSSEIAETVRISTQIAVFRDRHMLGTLEGTAIQEDLILNAIAEGDSL